MKVLVTGGSGFQGSNLSKALTEQGHDVTTFNTLSQRSLDNLDRFCLKETRNMWGSITDNNAVEKVVRDHDVVFHLAANIHVDESIAESRKYYETNVLGTYNVVHNCQKNHIPLIHVSSCEVYGGCDHCNLNTTCDMYIKETCPLKPQSPYAASKAGADTLCFAHAVTYNTPILILRPFNIFGPGQRYGARGAVVPIFTHKALTSSDIIIYGDGSQARDFVFIDDLIRAYTFLMGLFVDGKINHRIINIGTGTDVPVIDIARNVIDIAASNSSIIHTDSRPGEVKTFRGDSAVLKSYGFEFKHSFSEGLNRYIEWFKEYEL